MMVGWGMSCWGWWMGLAVGRLIFSGNTQFVDGDFVLCGSD